MKTGAVGESIPSSTRDALIASNSLEFKEASALSSNRGIVLVPMMAPAEDETITWDQLGGTALGVYVVDMDLTAADGGLFLRYIGAEANASSPFDDEPMVILQDVPKWFLTTRPSAHGLGTHLERMVDEVLATARRAATRSEIPPVTAPSGLPLTSGAPLGEGVGKKYLGCQVMDFNGDIKQVNSKEGAYKKMTIIAALIREMEPARLDILCPDYHFDYAHFWTECFRHLERTMPTTDFMWSISQMRDVLELPVCRVRETFEAWTLGVHSSVDYKCSLRDFAPYECTGWTRDVDYKGRKNLWRAFKGWLKFQFVFKGRLFWDCLDHVKAFWKSSEKPMERYHNTYIHWKLETLIRAYFYEIALTRGREAKLYSKAPIVNQQDCVGLLSELLHNFTSAVQDGSWEPAPHPVFYAPMSQYSLIINNPYGRCGGPDRSAVATSTTAPSDTGGAKDPGQGVKLDKAPKPAPHKHGLCVWSLAGALKLTNGKNEVFECRDKSFPHALIKTVQYGTVTKLLSDAEFMTPGRRDFHERLRAAVAAQKSRFAK